MIDEAQLIQLMQSLNYNFKQQDLLIQALTHRSVANINNERLEFLGDAVLGMVIAQALYQRFPEATEGELSRLRASLVNKDSLAELAKKLDLGEYVNLGSSELKSGGRQRHSILADALEAMLGAIYLDSDFTTIQQRILDLYAPSLSCINTESLLKDAKTRLQEYMQAHKHPLPSYDIILVEGKDHQQQFHVRCQVQGLENSSQGQGGSRRKAEQAAAQSFLEQLYDK